MGVVLPKVCHYLGGMTTPRQQKRGTRTVKVPPHVDLKTLRKVAGWTIDRLCAEINRATGASYQKGTISAIESGLRGASDKALADIAAAYGLPADTITVAYVPRATTKVAS